MPYIKLIMGSCDLGLLVCHIMKGLKRYLSARYWTVNIKQQGQLHSSYILHPIKLSEQDSWQCSIHGQDSLQCSIHYSVPVHFLQAIFVSSSHIIMSTLLNQMDKTEFSNNHHIHCNTIVLSLHITCICYTVNILHKA